MSYFDGINAIREERNAYYQKLLDSQNEECDISKFLVMKTRANLARAVQSSFIGQSPRRRGGKK